MELTQLKQFRVVAETENLVDASNILNISQPALTKSIQKLETELGTTLFDRTNHKLVLNAAGKDALKYINSILADLDHMLTDLKYASSDSNQFRIVSSLMSIQMFLSPQLGKAFPDMDFYYQTRPESQFSDYLKEGLFDIAISSTKIQDPEIDSKIILKDWHVISVPDSSPLYSKKVLTLEDLRGSTFMTSIDATDLPAPSLLINLLEDKRIPVHYVTMANSLSVVSMAAYNDYLFCASSIGALALDYRPYRRFIPIDPNENVYLNFYISFLKKNRCQVSPYVTWFKQQFNDYVLSKL